MCPHCQCVLFERKGTRVLRTHRLKSCLLLRTFIVFVFIVYRGASRNSKINSWGCNLLSRKLWIQADNDWGFVVIVYRGASQNSKINSWGCNLLSRKLCTEKDSDGKVLHVWEVIIFWVILSLKCSRDRCGISNCYLGDQCGILSAFYIEPECKGLLLQEFWYYSFLLQLSVHFLFRPCVTPVAVLIATKVVYNGDWFWFRKLMMPCSISDWAWAIWMAWFSLWTSVWLSICIGYIGIWLCELFS